MANDIKYISKAFCAKCNKPIDVVQRVHVAKGNRRFLRAEHHGETIEFGFADEPNHEMMLFEPPKDAA